MPAKYSVAKSTYTQQSLWAIVVEDTGAYAVVRPDGSTNDDQERRITRLFEMARKKPETPDDLIRLASINQSAVAISMPIEVETFDEAKSQAIAALG